ncbi:hypothetical protein [Trabulsiella odontotermitis]|uniref:hypothetical protein n=1 Tax=Trabulsiella odontotermitis TaxID=379893 RepID=UPI000675E632|nr:hypothetical protein [Trabulsiella odontotermitis]KNC89701.1 hypothetical protein GM30_06775 [Trabulsiella odontotermitis]
MDRNTWRKSCLFISLQVAAGAIIYGGHQVAINETGFAVPADPGTATDNLAVIGVSDEFVDNTNGADGAAIVMIRRGEAFFLGNSSAKPVTQVLVGKPCQVEDSVTVCADDTVNRTAGTVMEVSPDGVWVFIS